MEEQFMPCENKAGKYIHASGAYIQLQKGRWYAYDNKGGFKDLHKKRESAEEDALQPIDRGWVTKITHITLIEKVDVYTRFLSDNSLESKYAREGSDLLWEKKFKESRYSVTANITRIEEVRYPGGEDDYRLVSEVTQQIESPWVTSKEEARDWAALYFPESKIKFNTYPYGAPKIYE